MISRLLMVLGLVLFGYSFFLFRRSSGDQDGLRIYGLIAYISLTITAIDFGTMIAPRLDSFGIGHIFLFLIIWKAVADFLLKPGFKSCDGDNR